LIAPSNTLAALTLSQRSAPMTVEVFDLGQRDHPHAGGGARPAPGQHSSRAAALPSRRPGSGKSHIAAALGRALVESGCRALFTRTTDLVQRLQAERQALHLEAAIAFAIRATIPADHCQLALWGMGEGLPRLTNDGLTSTASFTTPPSSR
jgi:IstB-like ATP binding protein